MHRIVICGLPGSTMYLHIISLTARRQANRLAGAVWSGREKNTLHKRPRAGAFSALGHNVLLLFHIDNDC